MSQVIIYTNENGNVSVCSPTGELPIEDVLAKDCPAHAIIVDASTLPQGEDDFFDAWRMTPPDSVVVVDLEAARAIQLARFNASAVQEAQKRQLNALAGIANAVTDEAFISDLTAKRAAIDSAKSTAELRSITL
jgi:hypothetical protein